MLRLNLANDHRRPMRGSDDLSWIPDCGNSAGPCASKNNVAAVDCPVSRDMAQPMAANKILEVRMWRWLCVCVVMCGTMAWGAETPATRPATGAAPAASRISAVTVYQTNALLTRDVTVAQGAGLVELVVGPLPASTVASSLYSEGTDGLRILTTRYRTRALQEDLQEETRKLEAQLKALALDDQSLQRQIQVSEANLQLLTKLETFTAATMQQLTEKGVLSPDSVTKLAEFIMNTRLTKSQEAVALQQKVQANQERREFFQREMARLAGGSDKTVREAVIVVDKAAGAAGSVRLNYLVSAASWRPQYKLRAVKDKTDVQLEYLAAIYQQSGEDWGDVELVLSTAQPMLNAAPPELGMLEVGMTARGAAQPGANTVNIDGNRLGDKFAENAKQAKVMQQEAQVFANSSRNPDAQLRFNQGAALAQANEMLNGEQQDLGRKGVAPAREGQSVTFHLDRHFTIPWRDDEQLIEVARLPLKGDYFYKAVPILTPHVYRLANLTNDSTYVILPGEATMYVGTDFVGRTDLPLVAIGEQFTAGFGVDPQLQVARTLTEKTRSIQGGNQVLKFDYRVAVSSYKSEAVKLQVWDRLPHSETEAVNVLLVETKPELSKDRGYVREDYPKNLLRWDLTIDPGASGEKAVNVTYQFKLEFAKDSAIGNFISR